MEASGPSVIYVLPTEEDKPPRAIVGVPFEDEDTGEAGIAGVEATWSRDTGTWMIADQPAPEDLSEAITDHAKELGVEW